MGIEYKALPPKDALKFWAAKKVVSPDTFYDLAGSARARAFTVSGMARLDQIQAVYDSLQDALETGQSFEAWKREILPKIPKGWKNQPFRVSNIFRTNVQTAYQTGRYKQMMDVTEDRPWWQYSAVRDRRTRKVHAAMHGIVRRFDDAFWIDFYPPNGFSCRCTVKTLSDGQMKRKGLKKETGVPDYVIYTNPETGMKEALVPRPDEYFSGNAAKEFWEPDFKKYAPVLAAKTKKAIRQQTGKIGLGVKNREDMVSVITEKLSGMSKQGIREIKFQSKSFFMATDANGTIVVSTQKDADLAFAPSKELLNAFKKLGTNKKLTFQEEYSLECLWHEIQHNNQRHVGAMPNKRHYKYVLMETVNQWVSRRTYPRMLEKLGGYKPAHFEKVKTKGYGYEDWINRFDQLVKKIGLKEADILMEMETIHSEVGWFQYERYVTKMLARKSGKKEEAISQCLKKIKSSKFKDVLKNLD